MSGSLTGNFAQVWGKLTVPHVPNNPKRIMKIISPRKILVPSTRDRSCQLNN